MNGGEVVKRARRRAHVSVEELAERLQASPDTITAWETGEIEPTFRAVADAIAACGLDLVKVLAEPDPDPHDLSLLETSLSLSVDERFRRNTNYVNFVLAGRRAIREAMKEADEQTR